MASFNVRVGGFYVNEKKHLVREITHEDEDGRVHWRSFNLETGQPTGDFLMCDPGTILQWAHREATPEEAARMDSRAAHVKDMAWAAGFMESFIKQVPDEALFAEVRRRGREVR
jgi:hypothetical protein